MTDTAWSGPRTASSRITGTRAWQKLAKQVLRQANHVCQIQTPNVCTMHATVVDKVIPAARRPDLAWDPTNLRASCAPCNQHKARTTDQPPRGTRRGRRRPRPHPSDALT